jgi:transposase
MRQVRDVLRLNAAGVSGNEIARRVGVAPSTVRLTLKRLAAAGLGWPLPVETTDAVLEAQLFTAVGTKQGRRRRAEPDWATVHRELKRKHVTLQILWDEYIEQSPEGYRYSRFCELYRGWASRISVTMRQSHAGGDKLFVDHAGDTVPVIIDRLTGKMRPAQLFVAVMGASNFTYAEASWTQALADWIGAHTRAFEAIGGVPNLLVPDNPKVAIITEITLREALLCQRAGGKPDQGAQAAPRLRPQLMPQSHGQPVSALDPYCWLMLTLRGLAPRTSFWRDAHFDTIRLCLIKVVARVTEMVTRIKIALPTAYPYRIGFTMLAGRIAKLPP